MTHRTESEMKAYVDGYNESYRQFKECLKGRKSLVDAIRKMDILVATVNAVIEASEDGEQDD